MRAHLTLLLAALPLAACAPSYDGPEKVKGLRVLAVQAEPPELGAAGDDAQGDPAWPPDSAIIRTLVGHPDFASGDDTVRAVVVHLACTPDPADPLGTVCTQITALSDPSQVFQDVSVDLAATCAGTATGKKGAITLSGLEACNRRGCSQLAVQADPADPGSAVALPTPRYELPADLSLVDDLAASDPKRLLGTDVVDLAVAVQLEAGAADLAPAAAVNAQCQDVLQAALLRLQALWTVRPHILSLKWIHVRGPEMPGDSPPNLNPQLKGIRLEGTDLPAVASAPLRTVPAGKGQSLEADADFDALRQTYSRYDTDGNRVDTRKEEWAYSWFSTSGSIDEPHTQSTTEKNTFTLRKGRAMLWLVARDLRGGEAFTAGEVEVPPSP